MFRYTPHIIEKFGSKIAWTMLFLFGGLVTGYVSLFPGVYLEAEENLTEDHFSCSSFPENLFLEETSSPNLSSNPCWWLNSGAVFSMEDSVGETLQGELSLLSKWRELYEKSDSIDTEGGLYPQNLFRLINKSKWQDVRTSVDVSISSYRLSSSPNRNGTNGVFLIARYIDANTLYLAGIRTDGTAVIKRKLNGVYRTLGSVWFNPNAIHSYSSDSNFLPMGNWFGLAMEVKNGEDGEVHIKLDFSEDGTKWQTLLSTSDWPGSFENGLFLRAPSSVGIRTDFLDAEFKNYKITKL